MRLSKRVVTTGVVAFVFIIAVDFAAPAGYEELVRWLKPSPHLAPEKVVAKSRPIGPPLTVTPIQPKGNDSSLSPIPLPLILVRTRPGRNSREGLAQIGVRAQSPQTYTAGALLANGARLTEIFDHYVVFERDGHAARLYLQGEARRDAGAAPALVSVGGTPEPASAVADSRYELTDYLRPSPVFRGDELHGYAVHAGREAGPFSQLGLQPGDVLTHINGMAVSNSSDSLTALQALTHGEVLAVEIERQGIRQTLSLDGSLLRHASSREPEITPSPEITTRRATYSIAFSSLLTPENRP